MKQKRQRQREREGAFMYRYLHGCKVTKSCGMLQVADPRPAPEELVLPAGPLHSRPEWFYHLKGRKTRSGRRRHHRAASKKKLGMDRKVQPDIPNFSERSLLIIEILIIQAD